MIRTQHISTLQEAKSKFLSELCILERHFNLELGPHRSKYVALRGNGVMDSVLACCAGGLGSIPAHQQRKELFRQIFLSA